MRKALSIAKSAIREVMNDSESKIDEVINKALERIKGAPPNDLSDTQNLNTLLSKIKAKITGAEQNNAGADSGGAGHESGQSDETDTKIRRILQDVSAAALKNDNTLKQRLSGALVKNDALIGLFPMLGNTSKEGMSIFFASVVSSIFFWFFGSKKFWLVPILTATGGYIISSESVQASVKKNTSGLLDTLNLEKSDHFNIVLLALSSILGVVVNISSGLLSPRQAMSGAVSSFANSLNDQVNRKLEYNKYIQSQIATVKAAPAFVLGNYALEKLAGAAGSYSKKNGE